LTQCVLRHVCRWRRIWAASYFANQVAAFERTGCIGKLMGGDFAEKTGVAKAAWTALATPYDGNKAHAQRPSLSKARRGCLDALVPRLCEKPNARTS
jgi:hypothetical protein